MATLEQELAKADAAAKAARKKVADLRRKQKARAAAEAARLEQQIGARLRPYLAGDWDIFKSQARAIFDAHRVTDDSGDTTPEATAPVVDSAPAEPLGWAGDLS